MMILKIFIFNHTESHLTLTGLFIHVLMRYARFSLTWVVALWVWFITYVFLNKKLETPYRLLLIGKNCCCMWNLCFKITKVIDNNGIHAGLTKFLLICSLYKRNVYYYIVALYNITAVKIQFWKYNYFIFCFLGGSSC